MRGFGEYRAICRIARMAGLGAASLALAHCSNTNVAKVDPRYGVKSSPRVVAHGQPVPKGGGVYKVGKPYTVAGRTFIPEEDPNYSKVGTASWYGDDFHGRYTANGEIFDMHAISAASPTLPLPSYARVTNLENNRSLVVRVNDRGPYVGDRVIDLSVRAAKLLGYHGDGLAKVKVEYVGRAPLSGSNDRKLAATLRDGVRTAGARRVQVASAGPVPVASSRPTHAPMYFDARPMTRIPVSQVPEPLARPYAAAHAGPAIAAQDLPPPRGTIEFAAGATPPAVAPAPPQVSAFAPVRYDNDSSAYISGRGLY
jgi:rare lipoprotein A